MIKSYNILKASNMTMQTKLNTSKIDIDILYKEILRKPQNWTQIYSRDQYLYQT